MSVRTLSRSNYNTAGTGNPLTFGLFADTAVQSASQLSSAGINTNGNYYIIIGGSAVQCYVNFTFEGGPYILVMVTSGTGSTYGYDATVWTDTSGGVSTALNPTSNTNQVHMAFYNLATTRTGLALYQNSTSYFHYLDHASGTPRALANGSTPPPAVSPDSTTITAGSIIPSASPKRPGGWGAAITGAGFSAMSWGSTYYRYGWSHGTPNPASFGYARFGWSADIDDSDSRDRAIGIGIKNAGGGPVGSVAYSAGYTDYSASTSNTLKGFLYIKN